MIFRMANLDFRGPRMGSLKSPFRTSYWSSIDTMVAHCLVFRQSHFLYVLGDRQTNRQRDKQHPCVKPPSLSRAAA